MSRERPDTGCCELSFPVALPVPAGARLALEDYARALTRAASAALITTESPALVQGIHLCGAPATPDESLRGDVEAFARELVLRADDGLGWS